MDVTVIFGGQFGSEGKGLASSYLAKTKRFSLATTDAGPNAGHTAIYRDQPLVTFHLPMAGVLSRGCTLWLNGGSIINPEILHREIETMEEVHGIPIKQRLVIHPHAAIIEEGDIKEEKDNDGPMAKISSTQKGVGAAARRKMSRGATTAKDVQSLKRYVGSMHPSRFEEIAVEVAQGYSLSINSGFYPHTTFRCCSPAQGLMNASIPTTIKHNVMAVIRVNPIRVGSLDGGYSGDVFDDQEETTWEALDQPPQYTTVTNRLRRVFTYSHKQIRRMVRETAPTHILINFAQTVPAETLQYMAEKICDEYEQQGLRMPILMYGYGPAAEDVAMDIR